MVRFNPVVEVFAVDVSNLIRWITMDVLLGYDLLVVTFPRKTGPLEA
jgi:hypothetical protein